MAIGKPLLVDQGRKEQGTVLSAQTTPLSTQVAAQKLSFADYNIGQANSKASFAVTDELINMAGAMGKAAIYIDNTKKEHGRLNMMKDWQEADDEYAQEFASAITYKEKTAVASKMQESIGARSRNYQSIGGSSLEAQKSLAALTNSSRSSLSKMNITSAQRLVTETTTGYDVEAKRISRVIANDPTADMRVQFEKFRVLQNSRVASQLITPEQAEFQQIDFQRIAHTARGKLLGRKYADAYINGGTPLPEDGKLIESYEKNTGLILDDIQKNMFTDSIDDIYAKKVREYNSIEEAEMKSIRLQNFEQKATLASELEDAYARGEATPEVVAGFLEKAALFGDPNFSRKVNKLITDNDYGAPDPNVVGEYTTPEQMELYTGKDFMKHGVYDLDAISKNLPTSANGRTRTDIRKFYNNLNVNLAKKFVNTVPNSLNASLAGLLSKDAVDSGFKREFEDFDHALFLSIRKGAGGAVNYKEILSSHSAFSSVYNGVLAKANELASNRKGVFKDDYLKEHGPEARAEELQKVLGIMLKEDMQKVIDANKEEKKTAKIQKEFDSQAMEDLVAKKRIQEREKRLEDGEKIKRENAENLKKHKEEQKKRSLLDDAKIEKNLKPLTDLVISANRSMGDTVDELLQSVGSDLESTFETMGKGLTLNRLAEDFIHSIVTYSTLGLKKEMWNGWDKTNEEANTPEIAPTPAAEDNTRNTEQPEQAPTEVDQIIDVAAPIVNQTIDSVKAGVPIIEAIGSALSPSEAEGASTYQDPNFDPDASGARGFDQANQPQEGTRNELAQALGLPPDLSESSFKGGTSEESDIEGYTEEQMDMPPAVMDEVVISGDKTTPNRAQQRAEAFRQAFPVSEPSERVKLRKLQDTMKFQDKKPENARFKKDIMDKELGLADRKVMKGMPYISSTLAGPGKIKDSQGNLLPEDDREPQLNLSREQRPVKNISDAPMTNNLYEASTVKSGLTIGFGHDVTQAELRVGEIHGIPFVNSKTGDFIDLDKTKLEKIFEFDFQEHTKLAKDIFNKTGFGISFDDIPEELQLFLTERAYSTGSNKMTGADGALKNALAIKNNLDRIRKDKRTDLKALKKSKPYQLEVEKLKKAVDSFIFNVKERTAIQPRVDALFKTANTKDGLYRFFNLQGNYEGK